MQVELLPIADFTADPENARLHDDRNLEAIARSLKAFGQQKPIVVDRDGIIVAGNGTVAAASSLGWTEIAVVRTGLNKDEARAYAIADNRTAELATWDEERLAATLGELDVDLAGAVGFSEEELGAMLEPFDASEAVEEEPTPEPPADPITKPGDLWLLGRHRLLCGDSTKAEDVERLMVGAKAAAIVSDPPYGMDYQGCASGAQEGMKARQRRAVVPVVGDSADFDPMPVVELFGNPKEVCLWGGDWFYEHLPPDGSWVVWDKRASEAADTIPGAPFEVLWSRSRRKREFIRHPWGGWINKEKGDPERHHPTQKPIRCMAYPIEASTQSGDVVADPFLGSGTTLIAAEQLGRKCYGMELEPAYCDVIVKRWENLTGQKAQRAASE